MPPMAAGLGGNIPALFTGIFGFGVALAALGGVAAGPVLGLYPGMDTEILIPAFIVIVIGGMGSLRGAFIGSLLIGIADTFGKAYFPVLALFLIYLAMAFVLLIRPQGLFGIKYSGVSRRAGGHRRQRAGDAADPRRRAGRARGDAGVAVRGLGLPAGAGRRDLHFRDLRHEPRSAARLHRADVAWPRRIFRARRLRASPCWERCSASTPGSALARRRDALAALAAALIGCFCVRTGGVTFLMLTLAFSQLVFSVALKWRDVTGGSDGLAIAEKPGFFGFDLSNSLVMYFMALIFFVLVFGLCAG